MKDPQITSKPAIMPIAWGSCLAIVALAAAIDGFTGQSTASLFAVPFLLIYLITLLPRAKRLVRVFFAIAVITVILAWWTQLSVDVVIASIRQMVFLAGLLTVLGLLRIAASQDKHILRAGEYLSVQPPSRRYLSLNAGGHLFGVLLNLGGLGLLLDMTMSGLRQQRDASANIGQDSADAERIFALRKQRMSAAVMRGFATIALWTPFGVALNTMLLVVPGLKWIDIAGWGLGFACIFMLLGLGFDIGERRRNRLTFKPVPLPTPEGGALSALIVIGHVALLGGSIIALSLLTPISFQALLISLVALYALGWRVWQSGLSGIVELINTYVDRAATFSTEIGVFSLTSFIGLMLAQIIPVSIVFALLGGLVDQPFALAMSIMWLSFIGGVAGVHPMISVTILAGFLSRIGLGDLSPEAAALAILVSWACLATTGPFITTAVFVSNIVDESPNTVAIKWNGAFSITAMLLMSACIWLGMTLGWF